MERAFQQSLLAAAMLVPVSLLAPQWAVIVAIMPALFIAQVILPDGPERDLPIQERLPSPGQIVLLAVVVGIAGAMGAALASWGRGLASHYGSAFSA